MTWTQQDSRKSRPYTHMVYDMMDQGLIDAESVADMCLRWMSEHDVETMCRSNDLCLEAHEEIYE